MSFGKDLENKKKDDVGEREGVFGGEVTLYYYSGEVVAHNG